MTKYIGITKTLLILLLAYLLGCSGEFNLTADDYTRRAVNALENNDPRLATIEAKNALLKDSSNNSARWALAQSYLKLREGLAAETEIKKLIERRFLHVDLDTALLKAMLLQGKYTEIIELATKALPTSGELAVRGAAYAALADLIRGHGNRGDRDGYTSLARSDFQKAITQDANNQTAHFGMARLAIREQNFSDAKSYLDIASKIDAHNPELWNLYGIIGQLSNDLAYAEKQFGHGVHLAPYDLLLSINFARILIAREKGDQALAIIEKHLNSHSEMPTLYYLRSLAYVQGGELERAADALNGVVEKFPNYSSAQYLLARVLTDLMRFGQAEVAVSAVLEFDPKHEQARQLLEKIRLAAKRKENNSNSADLRGAASTQDLTRDLAVKFEDDVSDANLMREQTYSAEKLLQQRELFLNETVQVQQSLVTQLSQQGEYQKIIDLALAKAQTAESEPFSADWAGLANLLRGDYESARAFFNIALKKNSEFVPAIINMADLEFRMKNFAQAESLFNKALALAPGEPLASLGKARLSIVNGDLDVARILVDQVMTQKPYELMGTYVKAEILAAGGQTEQWLETIEELRNIDQNSTTPLLLLAKYHARQAHTKKALELISSAQKMGLDKNEVRAAERYIYANAGRAALIREDFADASSAFEELLKLDPNNILALNNLAWTRYAGGYKGAMEVAKQAHSLNPDSVPVLDTYAMIALQENDVELAVELLHKASQLAPLSGDIHYHYAMALKQLGQSEQAVEEAELALTMSNLTDRDLVSNFLESLR